MDTTYCSMDFFIRSTRAGYQMKPKTVVNCTVDLYLAAYF